MARRRLWQAPSREAQKRAFDKMTEGRHWRGLDVSVWPPSSHEGLSDFLAQELAALSEEERRREGGPAKLGRLIRATWLDHHQLEVSAALGSHCVKRLERFLELEAANAPARNGPTAKETARQLAGTLLAYEEPMRLTYSLREWREEPNWPVLHSYRGLSLPLKL